MHAAASAVTEGLPTRTQRKAPVERPAKSRPVEIALELHAVPWADVARPVEVAYHEEVMPRERSEIMSRIANVTIAVLALVLMAPVLALIALAIKLTSKGPVFYSQMRVGVDRRYRGTSLDDRRLYDHGGKPFLMYKFRTMQNDAEKNGQAVWAVKQDPRVTPIGTLLRRSRLDELPQLYNVIRGDMNIVGPRPERPAIFANLRTTVPQYCMRQRVKPGITGWAQINQPYDACVDDVRRKVQYDLEYMKRQGLAEDLRIMSMTLPVMMFRKGGW